MLKNLKLLLEELKNKGYKIDIQLHDKLNSFDGTVKSLEYFFAFIDNEQNINFEIKNTIKCYFKDTLITNVKNNLGGIVSLSILSLLDSFIETGSLSTEQMRNITFSEFGKKIDEFDEEFRAFGADIESKAAKDISTNEVFREGFGRLRNKVSKMYGISSDFRIGAMGVSMINFEIDKGIMQSK